MWFKQNYTVLVYKHFHKHLSRALSSLKNPDDQSFQCNYCFHRLSVKIQFKEHKIYCSTYDAQNVKLSGEEDKWIYFKENSLCYRIPYMDCESFVVPIEKNSINMAYHTPASFCYVTVDWTGKDLIQPVFYRGENFMSTFWSKRLNDVDGSNETSTKDNECNYENSRYCQLC